MISTLRYHGRNLFYSIALSLIGSGIHAQVDEIAMRQAGPELITTSITDAGTDYYPLLISQDLISPVAILGSNDQLTNSNEKTGIWSELQSDKWILLIALTLLISVVLNVVQFLRIVKLTHGAL